jgi:hypothetical protein
MKLGSKEVVSLVSLIAAYSQMEIFILVLTFHSKSEMCEAMDSKDSGEGRRECLLILGRCFIKISAVDVILGKFVEGAGLKLTIIEKITWERIHSVSIEIKLIDYRCLLAGKLKDLQKGMVG